VLLYSVIAFVISILLMWYAISAAVTNPVLRPHIIRTQGRMGLFNIARLFTTVLAAAGVWYSAGWVAGVLTYVATEVIRWVLLKTYTKVSVRMLTTELLRWQQETLSLLDPDEALTTARDAASDTVNAWIRGEE